LFSRFALIAGEGARAPSTNRLVPDWIDFLGKATHRRDAEHAEGPQRISNQDTTNQFVGRGSGRVILYTLFMNKRAKKRLKEAIEKDRVERTMTRQEPNPSAPKELRNPRGFLPKPAKKRG